MRIIGIDPGVATIGIGVLDVLSQDQLHANDWLTIQTASGLPLAERLEEIYRDLSAFLEECRPDLAVVERLFFATNEKTALDVAHARGVILLAVREHGIPFLEPTPLELKAGITGDGRADKRQVQDMLCHLLKLKEIPRPDDAADALALAAFGALHHKTLRLHSETKKWVAG
ncbi:crossover junction endodeoxyribonuclease RuvC [Candidatus Peregrinibacteria bacterium]|nr:crossover junction endodeoxyribonuclease RuvC [Candidatus Peregrinibacteria bacterium]